MYHCLILVACCRIYDTICIINKEAYCSNRSWQMNLTFYLPFKECGIAKLSRKPLKVHWNTKFPLNEVKYDLNAFGQILNMVSNHHRQIRPCCKWPNKSHDFFPNWFVSLSNRHNKTLYWPSEKKKTNNALFVTVTRL